MQTTIPRSPIVPEDFIRASTSKQDPVVATSAPVRGLNARGHNTHAAIRRLVQRLVATPSTR
jgi:hypothetical protein